VRNLADVSRVSDQPITAEVRCEELSFPPDQAAPLALFVTEAITNAYKHAFADRDSGRIEIVLSCDDGQCRVEVIDDGVGEMENARSGTGSSLMRAFATQLGGTVERGAGENGGHKATLLFSR